MIESKTYSLDTNISIETSNDITSLVLNHLDEMRAIISLKGLNANQLNQMNELAKILNN